MPFCASQMTASQLKPLANPKMEITKNDTATKSIMLTMSLIKTKLLSKTILSMIIAKVFPIPNVRRARDKDAKISISPSNLTSIYIISRPFYLNIFNGC